MPFSQHLELSTTPYERRAGPALVYRLRHPWVPGRREPPTVPVPASVPTPSAQPTPCLSRQTSGGPRSLRHVVEGVRVGAGPLVAIQLRNVRHVGAGQLEVEDV